MVVRRAHRLAPRDLSVPGKVLDDEPAAHDRCEADGTPSRTPRRNLVPRLLAGAEAGRAPRACLRDLRCHKRARQGTVGPFLQLCLYETRVVNS
jgi:hypothetical protein